MEFADDVDADASLPDTPPVLPLAASAEGIPIDRVVRAPAAAPDEALPGVLPAAVLPAFADDAAAAGDDEAEPLAPADEFVLPDPSPADDEFAPDEVDAGEAAPFEPPAEPGEVLPELDVDDAPPDEDGELRDELALPLDDDDEEDAEGGELLEGDVLLDEDDDDDESLGQPVINSAHASAVALTATRELTLSKSMNMRIIGRFIK